jgi:pyruvate kinase
MPRDAWDARRCALLIGDLEALRAALVEAAEDRLGAGLVIDERLASATNLAHYLALRRFDLRRVQDRLAEMGLSSLGRSETHVLANLDKVLGILHRLAGRPWQERKADEPAGYSTGARLLEGRAEALFGASPADRRVRIMVTMPSEAAHDAGLVGRMADAGMDIARINCAHDDADAWSAMARNVRRASRRSGRPVRVLMDLGGPKLRTGRVGSGPAVLRVKPRRDAFGRVLNPALLALRAPGSNLAVDPGAPHLGVDASWLQGLRVGDTVRMTDTRGAHRRWLVVTTTSAGALMQCEHTAYVAADTELAFERDGVTVGSRVSEVPVAEAALHLAAGDRIDLVSPEDTRPGPRSTVPCTLPEALPRLLPGQRVWFDDGRIGGVVRHRRMERVCVEIDDVPEGGAFLRMDKGINLPDTALELPALTDKDLADLDVVVRHADIVGLSFAQSADDVNQLGQQLAARGAGHLGMLLKVETRRGFEALPDMLFAALGWPAAGVMIARGDLAVECGFERMAEVQEEVLWACEAAHVPVVWATQVLETLARTGRPSRAEITDAAMSVRAECVMLNKGPHIIAAIRTLSDILGRMQAHQNKKRPLMRALRSWSAPA